MRITWLPAGLAAFAFAAFVAAFSYELVTYQEMAVAWANGDINSRAHLAAANLAEPLRTQDFAAVRRMGLDCEADGVHLLVTSDRGGVVYSSRSQDARDLPFYSERCSSGEYWVMVGMPQGRVQAPFRKAIRGFLLAGLVGMAGVVLFFFVTYRQRVRIRELKRLERFRREFVADVSHEIKTPLTGILGAVDMLSDVGPAERTTFEKLLGMIRGESKRLNALVQQILDLARLERADVPLDFEDVSVADLVRESVGRFSSEAAAAGIRLATGTLPGADVAVRCDAQRIGQAIGNLIGNALRHSGSEDVIVSADVLGARVEIAVEDHGRGIPAEESERVFERFHRLDPSRAATSGGAGLGLAIVRGVAERHGGSVRLEANRPRGCRFLLSLPRVSALRT